MKKACPGKLRAPHHFFVVGKREGGFAVAAVGRAEDGVQRFVPPDLQRLPVAECPADRRKRTGEESNLPEDGFLARTPSIPGRKDTLDRDDAADRDIRVADGNGTAFARC